MKMLYSFYAYLVATLTVLVTVFSVLHIRTVANELPEKGEESAIMLSYELIDMARSNNELLEELYKLKSKEEKLSQDVFDSKKSRENAQSQLNEYRKNNGFESVSGPGVVLTVKGNLVTEEIVDLINGIRNVKPLAIGVNNKRLVYDSYIIVDGENVELDNVRFGFPFMIYIIGNPEDIHKSLDRSGGVLDVIKKNSYGKADFDIEKKDFIELPPVDRKIQFRFSKNVQ